MLIDLHNHTGWGSGDSHLDPARLVEHARMCGLDGIAITEHNQVWDPTKVRVLREKTGFLVLAGCEVNTHEGHMLVFGLPGPRRWSRLPSLRELRELVDEHDGAIVAAHPFRGGLPGRNGAAALFGSAVGAANHLRGLVDGIEAFNGLAGDGERQSSSELARLLGLPTTGGSDTHRMMDVASSFTYFEQDLRDEVDLVEAIRASACEGSDWTTAGLPDGRRAALARTTNHVSYR